MMIVISRRGRHQPEYLLFATFLGLDMGMFYKRRDYSNVVDGRNRIVAHEYMGDPVEGKDMHRGRRHHCHRRQHAGPAAMI